MNFGIDWLEKQRLGPYRVPKAGLPPVIQYVLRGGDNQKVPPGPLHVPKTGLPPVIQDGLRGGCNQSYPARPAASAQGWITSGDPGCLTRGLQPKVPPGPLRVPKTGLPPVIQYVLRGGLRINQSRPAARAMGFFICLLWQASLPRRQIKNPALRAGLIYSCPRLDSNQHAVSSATTSR